LQPQNFQKRLSTFIRGQRKRLCCLLMFSLWKR
jgi:hypothetical protein